MLSDYPDGGRRKQNASPTSPKGQYREHWAQFTSSAIQFPAEKLLNGEVGLLGTAAMLGLAEEKKKSHLAQPLVRSAYLHLQGEGLGVSVGAMQGDRERGVSLCQVFVAEDVHFHLVMVDWRETRRAHIEPAV